MVSNHGDRKSPKDRVVGPLPNGLFMAEINGGDPNYLLTGMILQVLVINGVNKYKWLTGVISPLYTSGQITIIPKPEFFGHFGGIPLLNHHLG